MAMDKFGVMSKNLKIISVEHLSKIYRLGQIGTRTFLHDMEIWRAKLRGKANPMLHIGDKDHGNRNGEERWVLRDVSFSVEQGKVLGVIGKNGNIEDGRPLGAHRQNNFAM